MQRPKSDLVRVLAGPELADCTHCELHASCHGPKARVVYGVRPEDWTHGGLMIIGEAPSLEDTSMGVPFVGSAGRLLDRLLAASGVDRSRVWITNAVLGTAAGVETSAKSKAASFSQRYPLAVHSCLPRLESEIAAARPGVILTLGRGAFHALAGHEVPGRRLVDNPCHNARCDPKDRKVGPLLACAQGDCDWFELAPLEVAEADADAAKAWAAETKARHNGACPGCGASLSRLRPRRGKCSDCGGLRKRPEDYVTFPDNFALLSREGVAGAVFEASSLPSRLDQFGVRYVVPTYHPNFLLRPPPNGNFGGQFAAQPMAQHIQKAARLLSTPAQWKDPTPRTAHYTDLAMIAGWLAEPGRYAVDVETNSYDGPIPFPDPDAEEGISGVTEIACVGFARQDRDEVLVVDTRGLRDKAHPFCELLAAFFARDDVETIFQNGHYDRACFWFVYGVWVDNQGSDTLVAHTILYPDEEHGLGFQSHEFLDAPHWKGESHAIRRGTKDSNSGYRDFESLALYNARDTKNTILLDTIYRGLPGSRGQLDVERLRLVHDIDMTSWELALRMTIAGMPLSRTALAEVRKVFVAQREEALAWLRTYTRKPDFVPTGKALHWALYEPSGPCGLVAVRTTDTGAPSTDKGALKQLALLHELPNYVLKYRAADYVIGHYIDSTALRWGADERIHPTWKPLLVTGRWSTNPNVQNWPSVMRAAFEAPPGRMLVGADYAQLELRIMADLSADPRLIDLILEADESDKLNPAKDPHSFLAARVFGRTFEAGDKTDRKLLRDLTKRIWYGSLYGAGAQTIVQSIMDSDYDGPPIQRTTTERVLRTIESEFPGVQSWRQAQAETLYRDAEVRVPGSGRRRHFPLGDVEITVAYNFPIQGTAADIVNWRMAELVQALPAVDPTAFVFAQVHDAIYVECAEEHTDAVKKLVTETLTVEHSFGGGKKMLYAATAKADPNWGVIS